jgi:hypothetical protein
VAIQIDSRNPAEVYKFPHMIGIVSYQVPYGRNRPNEILYPLGCYLRFPYNTTTASQGLEDDVEDHLASTPTMWKII